MLEANQTFTPDIFDDTYVNMELALPRGGGEVELGRVTKRLRDKNDLPIGTAYDNPILDTRVYEVEFPDGHKTSLAANAIAENVFSHRPSNERQGDEAAGCVHHDLLWHPKTSRNDNRVETSCAMER